MNPKVDWFFNKDTKWKDSYNALRAILLDCDLQEELKWGCPCYTYQDGNVVLIHGFKNYCALLFHKGVLLKDKHNLLIQQTKNVQSARQIRFNNLDQIIEQEKVLKAYIKEAIEVEKAGKKVKLKKTKDYPVPEEFKQCLQEDPELKAAFYALTPGRQRGYLLHFSSAKKTETRLARIEKNKKKIMNGKGLDD